MNHKRRVSFASGTFLLLFAAGWAMCAENIVQSKRVPGLSNSVISLRNITTDQGRAYITQVGLTVTISTIPQKNALVLTAAPADLIKARSVLTLVDSKKNYVVKTLPEADAQAVANFSKVNNIDDVSVGTLMDPPSRMKANPVIVDLFNNVAFVIAPADVSEKIAEAIVTPSAKSAISTDRTTIVEPNKIQTQAPAADKQLSAAATSPEQSKPAKENLSTVTDANRKDIDQNDFFNAVVNQLLEEKQAEAAKKAASSAPATNAAVAQAAPAPSEPNVEAPAAAAPVEKAQPEQAPAATATPEPQSAQQLQQAVNDAAEQARTQEANVPGAMTPAQEGSEPNNFEPSQIPNGEEVLKFTLPENIQVAQLLEIVGDTLGVNYLYDPAKVTGSVTIKIRGPIKVKDLYALTESVLRFSGFVMSRRGNLVTIVPAAEAPFIDPKIKVNSDRIQPGDVVVTSVFHLNYISVDNAINLLVNMKLGVSAQGAQTIFPVRETNSIIVTEFAYRMERIEKLLRLIDQPGPPREFKFRQLKYTLASMLVPKIQSLAQQLGPETLKVETGAVSPQPGMAARRYPSATRPPIPGQPAQPAAVGQATERAGVFLDYDERTNRILIVGSSSDIALIEQLIDTFDVPQQDLRTIQEYNVQYVDARQVVDTLSTLGIVSYQGTSGYGGGFGSTQYRQPQAGMAQPQAAPQALGTQAAQASPQEQPQIAILESTNSLLVNATPEQHAAIMAILAHVDREPADVAIPYVIYPLEYQDPAELQKVLMELIERTVKDKEGKVQQTVRREDDIAIVADEKAFSLIVYASKRNQDWVGNLIRQLDKKRPQVLIETTLVQIDRDDAFNYELSLVTAQRGGFGAAVPGTVIGNTATTSLAPLATNDNQVIRGSTSGSGFSGFYSDSHIQALLQAVQSKSYGRVLAKPKILVNDNEKGSIKTQDTVYVPNSTTQVPTTGSAITSTTFQAYDAKLELEITPHISEGDLLLLEVKLTREDFVPGSGQVVNDVASPPDKTSSNVDTIVTVPDGSTIILGGLIKLNQLKRHGKVPILGDIPLVGVLFRSIDNTDSESKLYVFVKAYVLRPVEKQGGLPQLEEISKENRAAFEDAETKFQRQQDIPLIPPPTMNPNRTLDEQ